MLGVEAYIGSPEKTNNNEWKIVLDDETQTNLNNICELVINIFDAHSCAIYVSHTKKVLLLSEHGSKIASLDKTLLTNNLLEFIFSDDKCKTFRLIAPLLLPSGLEFGWLVFDRKSANQMNNKEQSILSVLQRDIINHLMQRRLIFEAAKAAELQVTISKLNQDFIFIKDRDFKIVYANDAFLNVYPKEMQNKVIGFTTFEEYEDNEVELFLAQDKLAFKNGISEVIEDLHMPDGKHIIVETMKRRFEDEQGNSYILGVCRDITEKEVLIAKLKKANSELDDFTSIASHDLKSPLNAIKRLLEWIAEDCIDILPAEHVENFELVINRADRMKALLDDLLQYAKIDCHDLTTTSTSFDKVYFDIANLLDIPDNTTIHVSTSKDMSSLDIPEIPFKTVILNILNNAIKHNDKEYGVINISLSNSRHYYIVEISDNGPGIDPKYFSRIFELFQTLRSRDEVEGSGLGLSVVMKHVNNFGGKIEVLSDGENGSTFKVFWPNKGKKNA